MPRTRPRRRGASTARIPRDLETIVLKALAKDPGDRFATADEMADELRRFVENRPIRSRPSPVPRAVLAVVQAKYRRLRPARLRRAARGGDRRPLDALRRRGPGRRGRKTRGAAPRARRSSSTPPSPRPRRPPQRTDGTTPRRPPGPDRSLLAAQARGDRTETCSTCGPRPSPRWPCPTPARARSGRGTPPAPTAALRRRLRRACPGHPGREVMRPSDRGRPDPRLPRSTRAAA